MRQTLGIPSRNPTPCQRTQQNPVAVFFFFLQTPNQNPWTYERKITNFSFITIIIINNK